jgi:acyl-CoA synthetase
LYYIGENLIREKILSENSSLSVLAIGGESCPPLSTLRKWKHPKCQTRLYNIYGITEVSSWATCCHITDGELDLYVDDHMKEIATTCKLGPPLLQTELIVNDDNGDIVVGNGIGHLQIGLLCFFKMYIHRLDRVLHFLQSYQSLQKRTKLET